MDLFGIVPESLRPYVPNFRHALIDLAQMDDRELSSDASLQAIFDPN